MWHTQLPEEPWGPPGYAGPLPQQVADVVFVMLVGTSPMRNLEFQGREIIRCFEKENGC